MAFEYQIQDGSYIDLERNLRSKRVGGREEMDYHLYELTTPACMFRYKIYFKYIGIKFSYPGIYNELGLETYELSYGPQSCIYLSIDEMRLQSGECDPIQYLAEVREALACHYKFQGRYGGPIYLSEPDGTGLLRRVRLDL